MLLPGGHTRRKTIREIPGVGRKTEPGRLQIGSKIVKIPGASQPDEA